MVARYLSYVVYYVYVVVYCLVRSWVIWWARLRQVGVCRLRGLARFRGWRRPNEVHSLQITFVVNLECVWWRYVPFTLSRRATRSFSLPTILSAWATRSLRLAGASSMLEKAAAVLIRWFLRLLLLGALTGSACEGMEWAALWRCNLRLAIRVRSGQLDNFLSDSERTRGLRRSSATVWLVQFSLAVHSWLPLLTQRLLLFFQLLNSSLNPGIRHQINWCGSLLCILLEHVLQKVLWRRRNVIRQR